AKYGLSSLTKELLGHLTQSLSPYALIFGVAAAALLIISIYLNQIYGKKISNLDTSTTDFMRFTAGIGKGSFLKAFSKWVGIMALQLLSGPGLFAAGGTLIAAIAHPVITVGSMALPAVPLAFVSVLLALLANIVLISIFKKDLGKVKDVTPTRFQAGVNSFVRAIAISIGVLFALQVGGGALAVTGVSIGVIAATLAAATIISRKTEKGYFAARWPSYIGSILGIVVGAGLIILSSIFGAPAVLSLDSIIPIISIPTAVIGILVILFQVGQAWKVAKEAATARQNPMRTFFESFIPNSRNIVMYALAIPTVFILFGGVSHMILFVAAVGLSALLINMYNVNFERRVGKAVSEHLSGMIGKVVMLSAGAIPMIVYPQVAYAQQMQSAMSAISGQKKADSAALAAAVGNMKEFSPRQMAGVDRLGRNVDNIVDEVASGKLIPAALASPAEVTASRQGEERAPPAVIAKPVVSAPQTEAKKEAAALQPIKAATHDQYQKIPSQRVFNNGIWKVESKPTGAVSSLYKEPIKLYVWDGASKTYKQVMYGASEDVGKVTIYHKMKGRAIPPEILTFNGSGYVRFSAEPSLMMGATMRIGAHNAGAPNEEFPRVTEARVKALSNSAYEIILTVDSEIYSGTVNIKLTPGKTTTTHVEAAYKMKRDVDVSKEKNTGFLAFSSMYGLYSRTKSSAKSVVHDTDLITVKYSDGTTSARALVNPAKRMSVGLDKPGSRISGFSLEQKDRNPASYKDRAAKYYARCSYGVKIASSNIPIGLMLNIDPTETDNSDNVYPVLTAKNNLKAGQVVKLIYDVDAGAGLTPLRAYAPSADERVADEIAQAIKPGKGEELSADKLEKYKALRPSAEKIAGLMFGGIDNIADSKLAVDGLVILFGNSMDRSGLTPNEMSLKLISMITRMESLSASLNSGGVELPIDTSKPLILEGGLPKVLPPAEQPTAPEIQAPVQTGRAVATEKKPSAAISSTQIGGVNITASMSGASKDIALGVGSGSASLRYDEKTYELEITVNGVVNKIRSGQEAQLGIGGTSVVIQNGGKGIYLVGINNDVKTIINPLLLPERILQSFAMGQAQHEIDLARQRKKEVSAASRFQAGVNLGYDEGRAEKAVQDARDALSGTEQSAAAVSKLSSTFATAFLQARVSDMKTRLTSQTPATRSALAAKAAGGVALSVNGSEFSIKAAVTRGDDGGLLYEGIVASRYSNEGVATFNFSAAAIIAIAGAQGVTLTDNDIISFAEGTENGKITEVLTNYWRGTATSGFLKENRDYSILTTTSADGRQLPYVVFNDSGNIRIASIAGSLAANTPTLTFTISALKDIAAARNITITPDEIKALTDSNAAARLEQILMKVFDNTQMSAFLQATKDYVISTTTIDGKEVPYVVFTENGSLKMASFTGSSLANTPTSIFTKDSLTKTAAALGINISADEIAGLADGHISSRIEQLLMNLFDNATVSKLLRTGSDYSIAKTTVNGTEVPYIVFTDSGKVRIAAFADSSLANQTTATFTEEALRTVLSQKGMSLTDDEIAGLAKGQLSVRLEQILVSYFDKIASPKFFDANSDYTISTEIAVDGVKVPHVELTATGQTKIAQFAVGSILTADIAKAGLRLNVPDDQLAALSSSLGSDVAERLLANSYGLISNDLYENKGLYQTEIYQVRDPTTGEIKPLAIVTLSSEGKKLLVGVVVTAFRDGGTVAIAADALKTIGVSESDIEALSQGKGLSFAERLEAAIFGLMKEEDIAKLAGYYDVTQTTVTTDAGETITAPVAVLTTTGIEVFRNSTAISSQISGIVEAGMRMNNLSLDIAPGVGSALAEEIALKSDKYWDGTVEEKTIDGQKIMQLNENGLAKLSEIFQQMKKIRGDVERILGKPIDQNDPNDMGYWIWAAKFTASGGRLIPSNQTLSLYAQASYSSYIAREMAKAGLDVQIEVGEKDIQKMQLMHQGYGLMLDIKNIDNKIVYLKKTIGDYRELFKNNLSDPKVKEGLGRLEASLMQLEKVRRDKERDLKELAGFEVDQQAFIMTMPQEALENLYRESGLSDYNIRRVEVEKMRAKTIRKLKPAKLEWDATLGGYVDLLSKPLKPVVGMRGSLSFDQMSAYARRMAGMRAQSQEDIAKELEISAYYDAKEAARRSTSLASQTDIARDRATRTGAYLVTLKLSNAATPAELAAAKLADTYANLDANDIASDADKARLDAIMMSSEKINNAATAARAAAPTAGRAHREVKIAEESRRAQKALTASAGLSWSYDFKNTPVFLPSVGITFNPAGKAGRELGAEQIKRSNEILNNAINNSIRSLLQRALDMMAAREKVEALSAQLEAAKRKLDKLNKGDRDRQTVLQRSETEVSIATIDGDLNKAKGELDTAIAEYEKTKDLTGMALPEEFLTELSRENITNLLTGDLIKSMDTEAPLEAADLTSRIMRLSVRVAGKGKPIKILLAPTLQTILIKNAGTVIDFIDGHRARETRKAKREAIADRVAWDKKYPHVVILGSSSYKIYEDEKGNIIITPPSGQVIKLDKVPTKEKPATIKIGAEGWLIYFNEKEDSFTLTNASTGVIVISVREYRIKQAQDEKDAKKNFAIAVKRLKWADGLVTFADKKLDEAMANFAMGLIEFPAIEDYQEAVELAKIEQSMAMRDYGKAAFELRSYNITMTDAEADSIKLDESDGYYIHQFTSEAWARVTNKITADQEAELSKVLAWRDSLQRFEFSQYASIAISTQNALILPQGGAFNSKNVFAVMSIKIGNFLGGLSQRPEANAAVNEKRANLKQAVMEGEQKLMEAYQRLFWARVVYAAKNSGNTALTGEQRRQAQTLVDLLKIDEKDLDIQNMSD
ncbi:MAG: glucan biosynthesis protein, partial [Candidatus Omnitrophota bacterium]|nr:glucan biosynthesis protein [Candidatus Omnitrophota bacterium]